MSRTFCPRTLTSSYRGTLSILLPTMSADAERSSSQSREVHSSGEIFVPSLFPRRFPSAIKSPEQSLSQSSSRALIPETTMGGNRYSTSNSSSSTSQTASTSETVGGGSGLNSQLVLFSEIVPAASVSGKTTQCVQARRASTQTARTAIGSRAMIQTRAIRSVQAGSVIGSRSAGSILWLGSIG